MKDATALLGRILLGLIFLASGFGKITDFEGTRQYMEQAGMPMTQILLPGAILLLIAGGLSLLLGFKVKIGVGLLLLFLIPATLIFHLDFADKMQMIQFMKNLSIMGGLLTVLAHGAGKYSISGG